VRRLVSDKLFNMLKNLPSFLEYAVQSM